MKLVPLLLLSIVGFAQQGFLAQPPYRPLTAGEKAQRAARNLFSPAAVIPVFLSAGINQARDSPEEWGQGTEGFGRRVGHAYGRLVLRNSFNLAAHVALRTDPRYDRCECKGVMPRLGHAVRRTFIVRTDSGGERIHFGNFASAYATQVISNQWMPDRYHNQAHYLRGTGISIGTNVGWNILREFVYTRDK
ncbi:MAG TPA: hypothetical protein VE621_20185 [Bryobacteraceae bacterium]|jgi:hypothetical protein|nr:hypothetical protein [Bryobacteraceae bacterium]